MSIFDWMNPGRWLMLLALCGSLVLGYFSWRSHERDVGAAPYIAQIAQIKAVGEAAQKVADAKTASDKLAKQKADHENKTATDTLNATIKRLRNARAGSNFLPAPAPGAASPATATIDRAEFERAMGVLDIGVQKVVDTGSKAVIDLDTAKKWAQPK